MISMPYTLRKCYALFAAPSVQVFRMPSMMRRYQGQSPSPGSLGDRSDTWGKSTNRSSSTPRVGTPRAARWAVDECAEGFSS